MPVGFCGKSCCDECESLQLTEREALVCGTVCESERPLSFSTIKKLVGLHQEILSRVLRRLQKHGAIEKTDGGYRCKGGQ